jgi:hypothetical protein
MRGIPIAGALLAAACILFSDPSPCRGGTGPFALDPMRDAGILAAGVSVSAAGRHYVSDTRAPDPLTLERNDVPGFDRIALRYLSKNAGDWSDRTATACGLLAGLAAGSPLVLREDGFLYEVVVNAVMYGETLLLEQGMTDLAKGTARRSRPYAYDASLPVSIRSERNASMSFWSGHTAGAFASAVFAGYVFQAENPESRFVAPVWAAGLTVASLTGVLRVRAGQHFPSDVLAGAAAGSFAGWIVPRLHRSGKGALRVGALGGDPGVRVLVSF